MKIINITSKEIYHDFTQIKRTGAYPYDPHDVQGKFFIYYHEDEDVISMVKNIIQRHLPNGVNVEDVVEIELPDDLYDSASFFLLDYFIQAIEVIVKSIPGSGYQVNFFSDIKDDEGDEDKDNLEA